MATLIPAIGTSAFDSIQRPAGALKPREAAPIGFILRVQPRTGGAPANAQRRRHGGRVLDRTATQSGTGAKAACGFAGRALLFKRSTNACVVVTNLLEHFYTN